MKSKRGCLRYLACLAGRQTVFSAEGLSRGSLPQHSQRTTVIGLPYAYVFCYLKPSRVLPAMSGMPEMEKLTPTNFVHQETGIPLTGQKLVYKGSVLHTGSVQECGIAEDDFVVVVVVRAVAAAVPPESGPVPASVQQVLESSRSCPAIKSARVSYVTLSCARCGGVTCSFAERSVELTSYLVWSSRVWCTSAGCEQRRCRPGPDRGCCDTLLCLNVCCNPQLSSSWINFYC